MPTAEQVASGYDLTGKVALVTGGNAGLGAETARVLALHGCRVIITSRKSDAAEAAIQQMKEKNAKVSKEDLPSEGDLSYILMDLADLDTTKAGVDSVLQLTTVVDFLVLNAGVMMPPYTLTKHNMELTMGTNYFGHFMLVKCLLCRLSKPPMRVVVVASKAHAFAKLALDDLHYYRRQYNRGIAYSNSKLANILYAKKLQARSRGDYLVLSLHPGIIKTGLGRHWAKWQFILLDIFLRVPHVPQALLGEPGIKTIPQGAATIIWAVLTDDVKGGEYCADCGIAKPLTKDADDEDLQNKLWQVTEEQLKEVEIKGFLPR